MELDRAIKRWGLVRMRQRVRNTAEKSGVQGRFPGRKELPIGSFRYVSTGSLMDHRELWSPQ